MSADCADGKATDAHRMTRVAVEICSIRLTSRTFAKHARFKTLVATVIVREEQSYPASKYGLFASKIAMCSFVDSKLAF